MNEQAQKTLTYYETHAQEFFDRTVCLDVDTLRKKFLSLIPSRGKILDAGCGSGRDTLYFKKNLYQTTAFDASSTLGQLAGGLVGEGILHKTFSEMEWCDEFDGVWAMSSLLHLNDLDLQEALLNCHMALKKKGWLYASFKVLATPVYDGYGRYFNSMDEEKLKKLLKGLGIFPQFNIWHNDNNGNVQALWLNILAQKI